MGSGAFGGSCNWRYFWQKVVEGVEELGWRVGVSMGDVGGGGRKQVGIFLSGERDTILRELGGVTHREDQI